MRIGIADELSEFTVRTSNSTPALSREHLLAIVIVAGTVALGAYLRFVRLGAPQLSRDEGSSWAGAVAPTIAQVAAQAHRIDPGKLAFYDIALHGWMRIFGDSGYAMRSMSAALGTISIVLLFLVVREFYGLLADSSGGAGGALAGAFATILIATNLAIVVHDRTARMYPMAVSASLGQMFFFARLHRRGTLTDYLGAALLTALAVGSNFTALALPAAEGIWLVTLAIASRFDARAAGLSFFRPAAAVSVGLALLLPMAPGASANLSGAIAGGCCDWLKPQSPLWPFETLKTVAGGLDPTMWGGAANSLELLGVDLVCVAAAVWRQWRSGKLLLAFLTVWVMGPMTLIMLFSVLVHPVEFPRYALIAFIGFFALVGTGLAAIRSIFIRIALIGALLFFQLHIDRTYLRNPGGPQWREAIAVALGNAQKGQTIVVYPPLGVNVVRYYLRPEQRAIAASAGDGCEPDSVLIISGFVWNYSPRVAAAFKCYPTVAARFSEVQVRLQTPAASAGSAKPAGLQN